MKNVTATILAGVFSFGSALTLSASATNNIAPFAKATASSCAKGHYASEINDGIARIKDKGEWVSDAREMFWGEIDFPWVRLDWEKPVAIDRILIYDRVSDNCHTASVTLHFSDATTLDVGEIPDNGAPCEVKLDGIRTSFVKIEITDGTGSFIGLSEVEVFPAIDESTAPVDLVNPFIETTRGRYFYFISGCQPFGMLGAAPMTRNKNQGGGGL